MKKTERWNRKEIDQAKKRGVEYGEKKREIDRLGAN